MTFIKSEYNILRLIYENPGIRLNDLMKKAKVSAATAKKRLGNFVSSGIIVEKKIIGGKRVLLKNFYPNFLSEEGKNIFSLIESEKKQEFFKKNRTLIGPFKQLIKNINNKIKIIIIFGSFATFSQTKDSDLDILLLIANKLNKSDRNNLKKEIERSFVTFENEVSLRIDTINSFKKNLNSDIHSTIIKNHVIIQGTSNFIRIIEKRKTEVD